MPQSFLDVARELIESPEAKAAYADDPDGFLAARGLDGLLPDELEAATGLVADAVPVAVARQLAGPSPDAAPEPFALARLAAATAVEGAVREAEPGTIDLVALLDPGGELGVPDPVEFDAVVPAPVSDGEAGRDGEDPPDDVNGTAAEADIEDREEEEGQERLDADEFALDDPLPAADDLDPGLTDAIGADPIGPGGALDDPLADLE